MSADWVLQALPNTSEIRRSLKFLEGADGTIYSSEWPDYDYVQGVDGYWHHSAMPDDKLLTSEQWNGLRTELGLDGDDWIWLGQVSYLKAGLWELARADGRPIDVTNWIPEPGQAVAEIAARLPVITPTLITSIMVAMNVKDTSWYRPAQLYSDSKGGLRRHGGTNKTWVGMARPRKIKRWLQAHEGKVLHVDVW